MRTVDPIGVELQAAGAGINMTEGGAAARMGLSAAMVAGQILVATTAVTANSRIMLTHQGGGANQGALFISARVVGVSFTIDSTNGADTGQVAWTILEPTT